ncbi:MAG: FecR domain-containing protein [Verrucomicrobiae bacterium]|nr:FecR domain-containing protein [Verrucomicrobiae bacterium]
MNGAGADSLDLVALCDAVIDGTIDEAGRERLSRSLLESPEARAFYVRYVGLSASLCHYAAELQTDAPEDAPAPSRIIRHPAMWWIAGGLAAAAALLLVAVLRSLPGTHETSLDTGRFVAVLLQTRDCRWTASGTPPAPGQHLSRGQVIAIEGGMAEIAFDCGAVVVIEGPASLELDSAWAATLRRGTLRAQVPPEAIGFRISNPAVEVVDLGTEFAVVADEDGAAEVIVLKGSVEAAAGGEPVILREKEARRFAKTGATEIGDHDHRIERLAQRLTLDVPPAPLAFARWSFDGDDEEIAASQVSGLSPVRAIFRAEPKRLAARTEGRWGRALRCDGAFSATASLSGIAPDSARTVAFWVRLPADAPLVGGGTFVAWKEKPRSKKGGSPATLLAWNRHPGQGAIGALRADRGPDAIVGNTSLRDGAWHHVAATLVPTGRGGKQFHVRLYVDGRLEATTASKPKRPAHPPEETVAHPEPPATDTLWIGRAPGNRPRDERLLGEIDELFIAGRALTHQEIRRLMKTNDPLAPTIAASP